MTDVAHLDLQYVILPARPPKRFARMELYNAVYDFWEHVWSETLRAGAVPDPHWRDGFLRQDFVTALLSGSEIVAAHLYGLVNLESHAIRKDSYFEILPPAAFAYLADKDYALAMTMEYLCVNPAYRRRGGTLSLADVLLGLGMRFATERGVDCCMGTPIKATKLDHVCKLFGGVVVLDDLERYGYELNFMVVDTTQVRSHPDPATGSAVARVWDARLDLTTR